MRSRSPSRFRGKVALLVVIIPAILSAAPGEFWHPQGFVEGRLGWLADTTRTEGGQFVHLERVRWGVDTQFGSRLNFSLNLGGLARQSPKLADMELSPEYRIRGTLHPTRHMEISLFSSLQVRNPMQIIQDTLVHREQIHGIQFASPLGHRGRLRLSYGLRNLDRQTAEIAQQFVRYQLEQNLFGLRFRLQGVEDIFTDSSAAADRRLVALHWYGRPLAGLTWSASNSYYTQDQQDYWRFYQRVNYRFNESNQLWVNFNQGNERYRADDLLRRDYQIRWQRDRQPTWGTDLTFAGNRVTPGRGDPVVHWRSYLAGIHWDRRDQNRWRGRMQAGYRESYRFGLGTAFSAESEETVPLFRKRQLELELRDRFQSDLFFRLDQETETGFRHDTRHELQIQGTLWPAARNQTGLTLRLLNHLGSDLDFSTDTLRNAVTLDLFYRRITPRLRLSFNHLVISDFGEAADTRLHLNSRVTYRINDRESVNFISMLRYKSEIYPTFLWLSGFYRMDLGQFSLSFDVDAAGEPQGILQNDLRTWVRIMRHL